MFDQIYPHLGAIFVGWMAALGAVALTAAFTERRVGLSVFASASELSCWQFLFST
jgi:hypothetical protein